jgi:HlyD family secretion protein
VTEAREDVVTKRTIYVVVAIGVTAILFAVAARPKPLEVEVATVARGPMRITVDDDGKTRVRERYTVPAPLAGTLSRVELHAGDPVDPGTVVAALLPLPSPLLDPRAREVAVQQVASTRDALRQAQAAVTRAKLAADLSESTLQREKRLGAEGALAASELERVEADARMKQSELQSLEFAQQVAAHAVTQAEAALSRFDLKPGASDRLDVTAPVHGRILHVLHGDAGPVSAGTPLFEVGDLGALEIVVDLLSQDAVAVRPGMPATVTQWGGPEPIAAHVRRVEPAGFTKLSALGVEEQRVNVLLDLDDPAPAASLGDGFAVEVSIMTWSADRVLQAPASALFREAKGWAAFVVKDGRATIQPIQVGHVGPRSAEITGGLSEGDALVAHPPTSLTNGARVHGTSGS